MAEPATDLAQTPEGTTAETTTDGSSAPPSQTTASGPDGAVESFFDPESIRGKPELEAAYKQMQASYTKKSQEFARNRDKVSQYDQFMSDPVGTMRQLAQQMGYQLVQGSQEPGDTQDFQTWDDVMAAAEKKVMKRLEPVLGEIQQMKRSTIEQRLDTQYPDWRQYEDDMMQLLQQHPTLVQDVDRLYRMAVPPEVLEARALKAAQRKLQGTKDASNVQGSSKTTKSVTQSTRAKNFDEAVELAKARLAEQGLRPPGNY